MMPVQEFSNQVLRRLKAIENTQNEILATQALIQENQQILVQQVKEVNIVLHGSEKLGVPPLHRQVRELYQFYDRAKWALSALGVTNIGFILLWVFNRLQDTMQRLP